VSNDSAPLHVACAVGARCIVGLFLPLFDPNRLLSDEHNVNWLQSPATCDGTDCRLGICRAYVNQTCLDRIGVEDVMDAITEFIE